MDKSPQIKTILDTVIDNYASSIAISRYVCD